MEQIKDIFLLSSGDTGGESTHTLTIDEMPSHNHAVGKAEQISQNEGGVQWWLLCTNWFNTKYRWVVKLIIICFHI